MFYLLFALCKCVAAAVTADKRIAIVISGLRRSFVYPHVHQNIWTRMVWPIIDVSEVFMAIDFNHTGRKYSDEVLLGEEELTEDPSDWEEIVDLFRPVYLARIAYSNGLYESLELARTLIETREQVIGHRFWWILRLRPDATYSKALPPWTYWPAPEIAKEMSLVWSTSIGGGSCGRSVPHNAHRLGVCLDDNFAVISRTALKTYVSNWPSKKKSAQPLSCQLYEPNIPNCIECRIGCALFLAGVRVGALDIDIILERPPRITTKSTNVTFQDKRTNLNALDQAAKHTLATYPHDANMLAAEYKRLWLNSDNDHHLFKSDKAKLRFIVLEACGKSDGALAQIVYDNHDFNSFVENSHPIKVRTSAARDDIPIATQANDWLGCPALPLSIQSHQHHPPAANKYTTTNKQEHRRKKKKTASSSPP